MGNHNKNHWIAPDNIRLPDFIICGAMKSGTTTVRSLLQKHAQIFIPDSEINFFDMDDIFHHSDFFFDDTDSWTWPDISEAAGDFWNWYQSFYAEAPADSLIGEDSTCYLPSYRASYRNGIQEKAIKTIICLRQPTQRAYSQYWHMLRTGRAMFSFEDTIKYTPDYVLQRSMYLKQVLDFLEHIDRDHVFFFVLEEFLQDKQGVLERLAKYLEVDLDQFSADVLDTHSNIATFPSYVGLQIFKNRMFRAYGNNQYRNRLPFKVKTSKSRTPPLLKILNSIHKRINPLRPGKTPPMNQATRIFLDTYFRQELSGLADIVGIDVDRLWFDR